MPIQLEDYTFNKRRFLKERKLFCVFVSSPAGSGRPSNVGIAVDVKAKFDVIQKCHWQPLELYSVLWTPGYPVAAAIRDELHKADWKLKGDWFDMGRGPMTELVVDIALRLYPTVRFYTHDETMAWLRAKTIDRADHCRGKSTGLRP